jgi:hypothetical protein
MNLRSKIVQRTLQNYENVNEPGRATISETATGRAVELTQTGREKHGPGYEI